MKRLIMIRHGKSEANENYDILFTKADPEIELVDQGYLDAVEAGRNLKVVLKQNAINEPCFVVSPYTRAMQTFRIIATVLNIPEETANIEPGVVEHFMNLKGHEGNWKNFMSYKNSEWSMKEHMDVPFEGGESLNGVRERARAFIVNVRKYFEEEGEAGQDMGDLVLVAHGLFIKMVMAELDGVEPYTVMHPANGEIVIREIK